MLENKRKLGLRSVDKSVGDGRLQFHPELSSTQHKEKNTISQTFLEVH